MQSFRVLLYQLYRPLFLWNLLFSFAATYFVLINGITFLLMSSFIKLTGYGSSVGFQYFFSAQEYYYYRNAGHSMRKMYTHAFMVDFVIYLVMVYVAMQLFPLLNA